MPLSLRLLFLWLLTSMASPVAVAVALTLGCCLAFYKSLDIAAATTMPSESTKLNNAGRVRVRVDRVRV